MREVVVDIPWGGKVLMVGFGLQGKGQVWIRDVKVEKVSKKIPVTADIRCKTIWRGCREPQRHPAEPAGTRGLGAVLSASSSVHSGQQSHRNRHHRMEAV